MLKEFLVKLISFYQIYLSFDRGLLMYFAVGGACKYPLPCSEYTKQAIIREGIFKGSFLGVKRIISCK